MPHPVRCFTEPVQIPKPIEAAGLGLTYIKAAANGRDRRLAVARVLGHAGAARASSRWRYYEIAANHMVASNRPHKLATLLVELSDCSRTPGRGLMVVAGKWRLAPAHFVTLNVARAVSMLPCRFGWDTWPET